jgi:acyl-CoA dehydrogenase
VEREIFSVEHDQFRRTFAEFLRREVAPSYPEWEREERVPKSLFRKLGDIGVIGMNMPTEYGGGGVSDYAYNAIVQEESARALVSLGTLRTHMDIVLPYFRAYASEEQKGRWFPGICSGELFTAIAMTEPNTGSDLGGITTAAKRRDDYYVLNGSKTFISGGEIADLVIVVARTSQHGDDRRKGLSLLVVEEGMPGFTKGRRMRKLGLHMQDTVELSFNDVIVPVRNRLGEEDLAFSYLGHNLPQERVALATGAVAQARTALDLTVQYVKERQVFGAPLSSFQNTKFELAAVATEIEAAQALLDRGIRDLAEKRLSPPDAAVIKLFCTEVQGRTVDRCLQLFGGYGYVTEYPIAKLFADARVTRIYGGTSEVMKTIIGKSLGL